MKPKFDYIKSQLAVTVIPFCRNYRYHLIAWSCLILNEVLAARFVAGRFGPLANYLIHYPINILFFYFNAHFLMPLAAKAWSENFLKFTGILLMGIAAYVGIVYLADHMLSYFTSHQFGGKNLHVTQYFLYTVMWRGIYFFGFSTGYYFILAYLKSQGAREMAERQVLQQLIREKENDLQLAQAKNAYLRAQLNPHFLFNSFNFLYGKSRKSDPLTAQAIMLLTGILRYTLESNHSSSEIYLEKEICQVQNLIDFWELKEGHKLPIKLSWEVEAVKCKFIPLALLTLTENMLIHGDLSNTESAAKITVALHGQVLEIITENAIYPEHSSGGMNSGLNNIKERLGYTYGENAVMSYGKTDDLQRFVVTVKLDKNLLLNLKK